MIPRPKQQKHLNRRLTRRKFGPEMRLKSQIINKSLSVCLPAHDRSSEHAFFLRSVRVSWRLSWCTRKEFMLEARRSKFLVNFSASTIAANKKKKFLLHFNADQNTQKVFLFVGVRGWCRALLLLISVRRRSLRCRTIGMWPIGFRHFYTLHIFFIIKNLK